MRPERNLDMIDSYWKLAKMARIWVPKNTVSLFSLSLSLSLSLWPIPSSWSIFRCEVYSYSRRILDAVLRYYWISICSNRYV